MEEYYNSTVNNILLWGRIGSIACKIAEMMNITPLQALKDFYRSNACKRLHERQTGLYLFSDLYIVDEYLLEKSSPI